MRQISFASAEHEGKKRVTRREKFPGEMEQVVPWARLLAALEPHYPKGTRGRPPIGLERMLRLYFVQQWYALSDEGLEDAVSDSIPTTQTGSKYSARAQRHHQRADRARTKNADRHFSCAVQRSDQ